MHVPTQATTRTNVGGKIKIGKQVEMKMKIRRWNPGKEEEPIKYIVNTSNLLLYTIIRSYYILNFRLKQTVRRKALEVTHKATH